MNRLATAVPLLGHALRGAQKYALSSLPYPLSNSFMPLYAMPHFQSRRLFRAQPGADIPKGTPGSLLAAILHGLGWTPDKPLFEFICTQGIPATISELYTFGEKTSLQHEYTIFRIDMQDETSWLRVDWTGDVNSVSMRYDAQALGAVIWTLSRDLNSLILPNDRLYRRVDVSIPLTTVAAFIIQLSETPYHVVFWNCIEFAQELHRRIKEATRPKPLNKW